MSASLRTRFALGFAAAVAGAMLLFSGAVVAVLLLDAGADARADKALSPADRLAQKEDDYEDVRRVLAAMGLVLPLGMAGAALLGRLMADRAVSPLREASQRAAAARASDLDLTLPVRGSGDEWDQLAQTLNALLSDTRGSLERIRRFTADAAHELRTPLTALIGEAEVALRRPRTAEELRDSLEGIRAEGERLTALVEALLTLARADAGTLLAGAAPLSLDRLAQEALDRARSVRPGLTFTLEGSAGEVQGDGVLLSRAVGNLLDNAARHAAKQVGLALSADPDQVRVRIYDDGPGIPPEVQGRLFERFVRGDPARSGEGLGLGLPIALAVARAHGGELERVEAARGAAFELRLPRSAPG